MFISKVVFERSHVSSEGKRTSGINLYGLRIGDVFLTFLGLVSRCYRVVLLVVALFLFLNPTNSRADSLPIPTNGLVGYWTGNNTAADSSPTANNGSFSGSYVPGRPGGDAAFDLSTGKVAIPDNPAYDFQHAPGWTVSFWFNTNGIPPSLTNNVFLGQDNGAGFQPKWFIDYGYTVFGPNNQFVWHVNDFNTERFFFTSDPVDPLPGGWNQLTVVIDNTGSSITFYLNGLPIGTDTLLPYVLETNAPLVFGQAEGLTYEGLMNDVAIYDRALSPADVTKLYSATAATPEPSCALLVITGIGLFAFLRMFGRKSQTDMSL